MVGLMVVRATLCGLGLAVLATAGPAGAEPDRLVGHGGPVKSVVAAPTGDRLLTASFDYTVMLWKVTGEEVRVLQRLVGHEAAANDAAFLPDATRAISVSDDGTAILWDLESGAQLGRFGETAVKALDVDVSADSHLAAVAKWDRQVLLIDLEAGRVLAHLQGNRDRVNAVALSPDGKRLYSGGGDGSLRLWSLPLPDDDRIVPHRVVREQGWGINVVKALPQGVAIGTVDGAVLLVSDEGEARELYHFQRPVMALALSADGSRLAAGSGEGQVVTWRTADWQQEQDLFNNGGPVWGLAFGTGGKRLWLAGLDDSVYSVDLTGPPKPLPEPAEQPRRFHLSEGLSPGAREFQRKCSVCHTLTADDANRAGPTLYRLFGRQAGSLPGYPYSQALLKSDIIWNEETIGALFDHGPDVVTPGTKMPIQRITDPARRDALIAFLKEATLGEGDAAGSGSAGAARETQGNDLPRDRKEQE